MSEENTPENVEATLTPAIDEASAAAETPQQTVTSMEEDWGAAMAEQAEIDAMNGASAESVIKPAEIFQNFDETNGKASMMNELDMILDIPIQVAVELGRTKITIKNLLQLAHGSVVELDAMAGEPMDVYVNGTLIAQGEVVVVNDKFGIRLTDIITPSERMKKIRR